MEAAPGAARPPAPGEGFFRRLVDAHPDGIVALGKGGVILYANQSAAALLGPGATAGARLADLVGDDARAEVLQAVSQMPGGGWHAQGRDGMTWRIAGPDGRGVHVEVRCGAPGAPGAPPAAGGVMLTFRDVTAQRAREDELRHRAWHDALTGLPNRARFEDRLRSALALASRAKVTAAVLYIDLDDFKPVNDTLGHDAGDELLKAVAARLAGAVRETDTAARLGGDEFAVLLEGLPGPAAAGAFAGRVVKALGEPFPLAAGTVSVGASVGVATTADSLDLDGILARADRALYMVKDSGKRGWLAFDASMAAAPRGQGRTPGAVPAPAIARRATRPDSPGPGPPAAPGAVKLLRALLAAPGPLPRPELARRAGVGNATASRALARLRLAGWLSAAPGPARMRPAALYALTPLGRAQAATLASPSGPKCPAREI